MFKVIYSQDKDIMNYLNSVWNFSYRKYGRRNMSNRLLKFFPDDFRIGIKKSKTKDEAIIVIKKYLESLPKKFSNQMPIISAGLEKIINKKKKDIINLLESVYESPFPFKKVTIYLTTVGIFPYNFKERWIMSHYANSIDGHIKTIKHELNHFMFYYYYQEELKKQGISIKGIEELKEALAIFTNPEGNKKPSVKKIENFIKLQNKIKMSSLIKSIIDNGLIR